MIKECLDICTGKQEKKDFLQCMHPVLINPGLRKKQEIQQEVQDAGERELRKSFVHTRSHGLIQQIHLPAV